MELRAAVGASFPGFAYSPEGIARFLELNAAPYDDTHYALIEAGRTVAVAMRCGDLLEYLVPTVWQDRYGIAGRMMASMREVCPGLWIRITEDLPSHASWYAGLLPSLAYELTPRVRMTTEASRLLGRSDPLQTNYVLASISEERFEETLRVHAAAFGFSPSEDEAMRESLTASFAEPDRRESWVLALQAGRVVGSCFGSQHRGRLFVEELAVAAPHRGQGLGRRVLLESVRRLAGAFPHSTRLILDVDRTNVAATRLYAKLGFEPDDRYIVARSVR